MGLFAGDIGERLRPTYHALLRGLLAFAWLITLLEPGVSPAVVLLSGGLAVLAGLWYFVGESRFNKGWFDRLLPSLVYFMIGWLLWFALVNTSPVFFVLLFVLFPYVFMVLPLPHAVALAVLLNGLVLLAIHRINSDLTATWMLVLTGTSISGGVLAYFIERIIRQSEERRRLIADLEAARADLARSEYETGVLHERQRLGGELHDTIVQGLIAIVTHLEAAATTPEPAAAAHHRDQAKTIARDNLREARQLIHAMQPELLQHQMFAGRLRGELEAWSAASQIPGELLITGEVQPLSGEAMHALLRVTREALTNIRKHAGATRVTVTLSYMADRVMLDVNDDGCGFDSAVRSGGFGLPTMRWRLEQAGGTLTLESEPGSGTTVVATLFYPPL